MNHYITGATIKTLREKYRMTQSQLAEKLQVSDKTISKWETGKGLPDISLLEPLSKALRVSLPELLSGEQIINANRSANILRSKLYVCPICGNILHAAGASVISCCGVTLPALEAEREDDGHQIKCEPIEDEYLMTLSHPMTKEHYISFIAYCTDERFELVKVDPEGEAAARFFVRRHGLLYWYCSHHGLFMKKI